MRAELGEVPQGDVAHPEHPYALPHTPRVGLAKEAPTPEPVSVVVSPFEAALAAWSAAAEEACRLANDHTFEVAKAWTDALGSNETTRKANVTARTCGIALKAELADLKAKALYHRMIHLRGKGDEL